uniref:Uncharacterized protein n=1 Tax=Panagrolaimus davidi TaxID=227884 RepID=A0A914PLV6_9BILA
MKNLNAQEYPYDWERWEEEQKRRNNLKITVKMLIKNFKSGIGVLQALLEEWGIVFLKGILNKDNDPILEFSTIEQAELFYNTFQGYDWKGSKLDIKMLCNENSPILYDSTNAHEMSKDYCIGKLVDEEKQPYTYDKKPKGRAVTNSIQPNAILIKNDDHTCIPNLQSTIPMPTTPTSMPYYSNPIAYDKKPIAPTTTTSNKNVNTYHYAGSTVSKGKHVVKQSANQKNSNSN